MFEVLMECFDGGRGGGRVGVRCDRDNCGGCHSAKANRTSWRDGTASRYVSDDELLVFCYHHMVS